MKIEEYRREIDEIDASIVDLLNKRAAAVREIGKIKAQANLPIIDLARQKEIYEKICRINQGSISDDSIVKIFRRIMQESMQIQIETRTKSMTEGLGIY